MKKDNIIILLLLLYTFCSCASKPLEGLYLDPTRKTFVNIQHDSISVYYQLFNSDNYSYYYGAYRCSDDTLFLYDNLLKSTNVVIDTVFTDYPGTEIQLYELYVALCLGCHEENKRDEDEFYYQPTKAFSLCWDYDKDFPALWREPNLKSDKDGLIQIPIETIDTLEDHKAEMLIQGMYFYTEQRLCINPHVRYVIKQKSKYQWPLRKQEYYFVFDKKQKTISISPHPYRIVETNGVKGPEVKVLEWQHKSSSSFQELKKVL